MKAVTHVESAGRVRGPRFVALVTALVLICPPLWAEARQNVEFQHLTTMDGLSHSTVWDVLQDQRGFLWIATAGYLQRYDGYEFVSFQHDPEDPGSVSAGKIFKLFEDRQGILWLATRSAGLDRYDPSTGRFTHFRPAPDDPRGLADGRVRMIYEDRSGVLWLGTYGGLHRFHPEDGSFTNYQHDPAAPTSIGPGTIEAMLEDRHGDVWVGSGGGLHLFDRSAGTFQHYRHDPGDPRSLSHDNVNEIYEDSRGELWIGTHQGLDRFDRASDSFVRQALGTGDASESFDVLEILEDRDGKLWIGTYGDGVFRRDRATADRTAADRSSAESEAQFVHFRHDPQRRTSLGADRVHAFWQDRTGILWISHRGGLDKYDRRRERFVKFRRESGELAGSSVWGVLEDRSGVLWISSHNGGLTSLESHGAERRVITHYRHDPANSNSLSSSRTTALLEDSSGELWVGHLLSGGLDRLDRSRRQVTRYGPDPQDPTSLANGSVASLLEDRSGSVWIGLLGGGVQRYDRAGDRFVTYENDPADPRSLSNDDAYALYEDRAGHLWVGTFGGLNRFDPASSGFDHYVHDPENRNSLSGNNVSSIYEDEDGIFWIGTMGNGLNRWDRERGEFQHYWVKDGLPSDTVVGIAGDSVAADSATADSARHLWLATDQGLARLDPRSETIRNYDVDDGLHGNTFFIGPSYRAADGQLFFGGNGGLTAFYPESLEDDLVAPTIAITDVLLDGETVPWQGLEPGSEPDRAAANTPELVLTYHHKTFSVQFAGLHFGSPRKNRFAFRLEGYDDWTETDARHRRARYTNLDPGGYQFQVRAANRDGVWSDTPASLLVRVLPPPWQTWWAWCLYVLGSLTAVAAYLYSHRTKLERERQIAERERDASRRLREADRLKDEFLANTSHELRTPLYGIIGLAESLIDGGAGELPETARGHLGMLVASGRRLTSLVNDILDFSKLKHHTLELDRKPVDLRSLTDVVLVLSHALVGSKELRLVNAVPADLPPADADEDRLQQILHNLVGNALKFTEAGHVEVDAELDDETGEIVVRVADTGLGIADDEKERIFRAFEQADASIERRQGGTGLGLSITRKLVELHGGRLWLESELGKGSTFFFTLSRAGGSEATLASSTSTARVAEASGAVPDVVLGETTEEDVRTPEPASTTASSAEILIVDDEPVIRQVLVNQLGTSGYRIRQAANGAEALECVEERPPDLVLLDVMMPRLSGYEVCRTLRERYSLDELPVIFLTAKSQPSDLVVGLTAGANDYLPKPISKSELLARVKTHLGLLDVHRQLTLMVDERTSQLREREQLLNERNELIGQLENRNAELARFNYTIAHDLKNPLTTIKNFIGMAEHDFEAGDPDRLRRDLRLMDTAADKLSLLLDELYEYSKIDRAPDPHTEIRLGDLVREAQAELAGSIDERGVEIEVAQLPTVSGDRRRLEQVVFHLLSNAVRYLGDQPRPRVEIGVRDGENGPVVYFRDNGVGIEPQYHEKIFELFERLDPDDPNSTGVGLALVKRIVEVHGGEVWVESDGLGKGSIFYLWLPTVKPAPPPTRG